MKVKMKPTSVIVAELGLKPNGQVQKYFTKRCADYMDRYIPMNIGNLRNQKDIGPNYVAYESPYARYQYYGKKMVMSNGKSAYYSPNYGFWSKKGEKKTLTEDDLIYHTPGTGDHWDERMWSVHKQDIIKEVQNYIKRGGKG